MHCTGGECAPFVTFGTAWSAQLLYTSGRIWARRRGPKPGSRQGQLVSLPRASEKYRELLMTVGRADANGAGFFAQSVSGCHRQKPNQQGADTDVADHTSGARKRSKPGRHLISGFDAAGQKALGAQSRDRPSIPNRRMRLVSSGRVAHCVRKFILETATWRRPRSGQPPDCR